MMEKNNYSTLDRILHNISFSSFNIQLSISDIEDRVFSKKWRDIHPEKPVFITSLPRGGTTILLNLLSMIPSFASHKYRDMPFVLSPLLWDAISSPFRKSNDSIQRAHGDGMQIGYDSPEAFEEILWRAFWPQKYLKDQISLWSEKDANNEFLQFFNQHMKKIIYVRGENTSELKWRYVSKNNANIARIKLLYKMFPDCKIIIPFRHYKDHAESLRRQHSNFLRIHEHDKFSMKYMHDIGHFEFGKLHKPIQFIDDKRNLDQYHLSSLSYWTVYWIQAFEHILSNFNDHVLLVSHENLCRTPESSLQRLFALLDMESLPLSPELISLFHPPHSYNIDDSNLDSEIQKNADDVYCRLHDLCLI